MADEKEKDSIAVKELLVLHERNVRAIVMLEKIISTALISHDDSCMYPQLACKCKTGPLKHKLQLVIDQLNGNTSEK